LKGGTDDVPAAPRLSQDHLARLPQRVRRPHYDRAKLRIGMAHIGVGAFHRCHQAEFTDDMLEARFGDWGVVGINLREPRLVDLLAAQDGLFSRTLRQDGGARTRVVGCLRSVIDATDPEPSALAVQTLAASSLGVVTMTVTEKGYCRVPATGALDLIDPDIAHDLCGAAPPRTLPGLLCLALERRRMTHGEGLTLLSCDNVPSNGDLLRGVLVAFAATRSAALARWIDERVAFPNSMVDRIVPATTPQDLQFAASALGAADAGAVSGEPFRQWVIEDRFAAARPPWDLAGALFVSDARPFELIKMRILNAAQSMLSHLGALVGHQFSFEAVADPVLAALTRHMLERESLSTLPDVEGTAARPAIDTALKRIANTAIRHRCHQIGTDGSQKIAQRLLNPLRERLAAGREAPLLTLSVAAWIAYCLAGATRFGRRWQICDPCAAAMIAIGDAPGASFEDMAKAALALHAIFGTDLAAPPLLAGLARHLAGLLSGAPRTYLAERLADG